MKRGITLIELLIALLLAGLVVGFAVSILRDENSNMIHVRSRVQSQTAARDGLKILESELRAAGFGVSMSFASSPADPTTMTSVNPVCVAGVDAALQSSVVAMDGANGGNDTLDLAYSTIVNERSGADCSNVSVRWVRYLVKNAELLRYDAASRLGFSENSKTIVGKNVDVFQVQLGASGISRNGKLFLDAADSCCPGATWTKTGVTVIPNAASKTDELTATGSTWSYLSKEKDLSAGETWRLRFILLDASSSLIKNLATYAPSAYVSIGLFGSTGTNKATLPILSRPAMAQSAFGQLMEADLVVPTSGKYRIGISGNTSGTLTLLGFNAMAVRLGTDSTWLKNPSAMNLGDWTRVKSVRVQVLTRAPADKKDYHTKFTGLSNFRQTAASTEGEFDVKDTAIRVLLDHVYPAGNNGRF